MYLLKKTIFYSLGKGKVTKLYRILEKKSERSIRCSLFCSDNRPSDNRPFQSCGISTLPSNECKAEVDPVLTQTSFVFLWKCTYAREILVSMRTT